MRYTITISIEAEQDLSCIYKSIVVNNEVLAKRVLDEFYEKIKSLEFFPYRNPKLLKKQKMLGLLIYIDISFYMKLMT